MAVAFATMARTARRMRCFNMRFAANASKSALSRFERNKVNAKFGNFGC